jgi:hypothetical protein
MVKSRPSIPPLVWIMLAAIAARAWLLFSTPFMPGVNGAYYLVQARTLIERGTLAVADMPLTFYLHAALSWLLMKVSGMTLTDAIMMAVKICDAVLPTLTAWPVFVLVRRWARAQGLGDAVPLAAAALVNLSPPWLLVVGDLQKNSLAMVWFAVLMTTLHGLVQNPTAGRGAVLLTVLLPLGLTHIGVLGAGLVLMVTVLIVFVFHQGRLFRWKLILPWLATGVALLLVTSALVVWKFDPTRMQRLLTALTNPIQFSSDGRQRPDQPGGLLSLDGWLPFFTFAATVVPALFIARQRRKELNASDFAIIVGAVITVLMMTGPWFSQDKAIRFYLIAMLPAILVGSFALLHIAKPRIRQAVLGLVLLIGVGSSATILLPGGKPVLSTAAMKELQSLKDYIQNPEQTLVVSEHGVEWWSAWFLHTYIAQPEALKPEDWQKYKNILFLEVKAGQLSLPGHGGPAPLRGHGAGPDDSRSLRAEKGRHPKRPRLIPPDAMLLYDGANMRLARVAAAPDFMMAKCR